MKLLSAEFHLNLFTLRAWLKNKQQKKNLPAVATERLNDWVTHEISEIIV